MIKETLLASAFGLLGLVTVACGSQKKDLMAGTDYVNPFIGASTNTEAAGAYHGLGKTFPGATTPFGACAPLSPNGDSFPVLIVFRLRSKEVVLIFPDGEGEPI